MMNFQQPRKDGTLLLLFMPYFLLTLAFSLNAAANILLKQGAHRGLTFARNPFLLIAENWQLALGIGLFGANVIFYFLALRALPLSVAYPIMVAMGFLIVNGYAVFFLGETIAARELLGYAFIVIGLVLVVARS